MITINTAEMVRRMTIAKGYTVTELAKLFKSTRKETAPILTAAMYEDKIRGVKVGDGYKISTRYYIAGTEPKKEDDGKPLVYAWQRGEMKGYEASLRKEAEVRMLGRGRP